MRNSTIAPGQRAFAASNCCIIDDFGAAMRKNVAAVGRFAGEALTAAAAGRKTDTSGRPMCGRR